MVKRKAILLILYAIIASVFIACLQCTDLISTDNDDGGDVDTGDVSYTVAEALAENCGTHEDTDDYTRNSSTAIQITLNNNSISVDGDGVTIEDSQATVTSAGTYNISGSLSDGQIIVDTEDLEAVKLILNGIDIYCSNNPAIYIRNAEKAIIILEDGTENSIRDGSSYTDDDPNAAIFSNDDLTICGDGSLEVDGNYNDAIGSDDGLIIAGGDITVTAEDDGIRGKDYLVIKDGDITVSAEGDGLKSDNDEDGARGYVYIEDGTINISADGDAIVGQTDVLITGGEFDISSGGGSNHNVSGDVSAKGIKADAIVVIDGGTFNIDSADDAIHSNVNLVINGGTFTIATGDDAIHADTGIGINGGIIDITECFEGIESIYVEINQGEIHIDADDDGINIASGDNNGPGGGVSSSYKLYINGGYIVLTAGGDGIDSNGQIIITDGTLLINGPTSNNEGAIDYGTSCRISDGFLLALGSSGMAQAPGTSSTQYSVMLVLRGLRQAGSLVHVESSDGEEIFTFMPVKSYQAIVFSSPELENGTTYDVYFGGSSTGTAVDGLYSGGTYSPGSKYTSFTITSMVTRINR